jgi:DNA-binding winged helix-turn-helix (wHTH) protein
MRLAFGPFTFDSGTRELREDGAAVHLSPKAFDLLQLLLEQRPEVVRKAEVQERIWPGTFVHEANLNVVVAEIRRVLGDDSKAPRFVRTVHRIGYAFSGMAVETQASAAAREPASSCRCWLAWNDKTFPLVDGENIVGRDPRCTVWLDVSGVSRRHARVFVTGDTVMLEDLGSSNGTFVRGGRLASPYNLADRDRIDVGSATMEFRMWSDERPPKTERLPNRSRQKP